MLVPHLAVRVGSSTAVPDDADDVIGITLTEGSSLSAHTAESGTRSFVSQSSVVAVTDVSADVRIPMNNGYWEAIWA